MERLRGRVPTAKIEPGKPAVPPGAGRAQQLAAALDNGAMLLQVRTASVIGFSKTNAGIGKPGRVASAGPSDEAAWEPIANLRNECTAKPGCSTADIGNVLRECSAAGGWSRGGAEQTVCDSTSSACGRDINA